MKQLYTIMLLVSMTFLARSSSDQIMVLNAIKPQMLEYKYKILRKTFCPETFALKVNGKPLNPGDSLVLSNTDKTMVVRYDYSFYNGWYTGAKEIIFDLSPEKKEYNINFSWDNEWRVIASGAQPIRVKRLKYNAL